METNKNILVTGCSKGLGLEIAKFLLEKDYNVFAINRSVPEALKALKEKYPESLTIHNFDLADAEGLSDFLKANFPAKTPLHGFVNNAALAYDDIISNLDLKKLETMYRVNVFSPMMLTKFVLRNMLYNKIGGSIVHISSISVHTGYKGLAMYASTKGALEAFSKNTAREWGVRGVRSNCLVAGFMETEMSSTLTDEQRQKIYGRTALKKATTKQSVAATVEFLLSDGAASVTGQNVFVDSGTI